MNPLDNELISVREIAVQLGKRKQTIFKILKRLGIQTTKRRSASGRNQIVSYITQQQSELIREELLVLPLVERSVNGETIALEFTNEKGVFYLIQLEPDFDPSRFKLGFAVNPNERLRKFRCCAPFAKIIRSWPCQRLWERTAIDSVSSGCERLYTEVYRTESLDDIVAKCEKFFAIMPSGPTPSSLPQICSTQSATA